MKKLLLVLSALVCLLGLIGCDPLVNFLNKEDLLANTVKIELVDYENNDPKLISIKAKNKPHFDNNKATLIATLDESLFENIINDIANGGFHFYDTALNEPLGKTLVLHQSNGNMIVMYGCKYTNNKGKTFYDGDCIIFNKNGELVEYIGRVGYLFSNRIEATYFS